jgi:hypothetical protein
MLTQDIAGHLLSSSPIRSLTRTASRAGRQLNRTGRSLNRGLQHRPLATVAALLATNVASLALARRRMAAPRPSFASRAAAIGAVAAGALALGAVSIGALAIARVAIRSMRIKRLRIDVLEVRETVGASLPAPTAAPA